MNLLQVLIGGQGNGAARAAEGCTPTALLPVFSLLTNEFTVPAAWPNPIEVRVVDDCGDPMVSGAVQASFSNNDAPLTLVPLRDGRWTGTWLARNTNVSRVTVTVNAEMPGGVKGSAQVTGGLRSNPNPPAINSGGIVNAASLAREAPLAPGSMISIFGTRLAERAEIAQSLPLGTQLGGTTVVLAGRLLPLLYSSDGQINAQVPFDIPVNTTHQVIVRKGGAYTVPQAVVVAAAQPAIFTLAQTGSGQGLVFRTNGAVADGANPSAAGETVIVIAAGLGMTDPPVTAGVAASTTVLSQVRAPVSMTIGGVPAPVSFAGLLPGYAGAYQVNAVAPAGTARGNAVEVVLTVDGQSGPPVTMSIR
ncbi:MAG: hypothetical protein ACRD44_11595 [Bryobacteraceae bacterium]